MGVVELVPSAPIFYYTKFTHCVLFLVKDSHNKFIKWKKKKNIKV